MRQPGPSGQPEAELLYDAAERLESVASILAASLLGRAELDDALVESLIRLVDTARRRVVQAIT